MKARIRRAGMHSIARWIAVLAKAKLWNAGRAGLT